jgi:hypothetical protein
MILCRLASDEKESAPSIGVAPAIPITSSFEIQLSSKPSFISMDLGSKYGGLSHRDYTFPTARGGLIPYEYDPALDEMDPVRRICSMTPT